MFRSGRKYARTSCGGMCRVIEVYHDFLRITQSVVGDEGTVLASLPSTPLLAVGIAHFLCLILLFKRYTFGCVHCVDIVCRWCQRYDHA